jgi:DNA-binding CsgD family transcriptional regulator
MLTEAERGSGRLLLIEGPAGIGKTRLLEEAAAMAGSARFTVLAARGGELERDFGFGVVRQLLEPVLTRASSGERSELLAGAAAHAEPVFGATGEDVGGSDTTHAVLHGLYWLVANLAERSPLLLTIDDDHWADAPSQRFLIYLARRLEGLRAAILLTARTGEAGGHPELLRALALEAKPPVLRPDALSPGAAEIMVRETLGATPPQRLGQACHEATGGNPFLLIELLRELAAGARPVEELDPATVKRLASDRIAAAILLRVGRLEPGAKDLSRAVAVLGESASFASAAALAGIDRSTAGSVSGSLAEAGVLVPGSRLRFVHPIVRTAIYEEIPARARSELHAAAARLLAEGGAVPESVGVHLLAIDPAGEEWNVEALREAARAALSRGAPETAARYLRRAVEEPPAPKRRAELLAELGSATGRAGQHGGVQLMREALELAQGQPQRARAGLQLATALLWPALELDEAIEVLERSLEGLDDPELAGRLEALLLLAGLTTPSARRLVVHRLAEARSALVDLPGPLAGRLRSLLAVDALISDGSAGEAVRLATEALADGMLVNEEVTTDMPFASPAILTLMHAGCLGAARRATEDIVGAARAHGSPVVLTRAFAFRALASCRAGDLASAEADARACLELAAEPGRGVPHPLAAATLAEVLVERGELAGAADVLGQINAPGYNPEVTPIQALRESRARLLTAEGKLEAALDELGACERWEEEWQAAAGVVPVRWRSLAALARAASGNTAGALELAEEEVELARRFGAAGSIGIALRALGLVAGSERGVGLLEEAIAALATSEARLEHARALVDLGALLRRGGKRSAAIEKLRDGMERAHRCGATALVGYARDELRLAGVRPRRMAVTGRDSLTPAERRVADLAAGGMRNKEIAQALFVTKRTVEMHLSNAYRKLEISSRDELPVALSEPLTGTAPVPPSPSQS